MSYQGHFENQKPKKKMKKGWKILLIVLTVLLVLVAAVVIAGVSYFKSMVNKVNYIEMPTNAAIIETTESVETTEAVAMENTVATTEETTVETTVPPMTADDIVNILLVGQSGRPGEDAALADTMILASVNTYTKTLTLTSFLRDTYVDLPDYRDTRGTVHTCGWNKLTSCYALGYNWDGTAGAMSMMNACLYNNFGVEVDYNFEVNFDCFIDVVDMLGGVALEITQEEADYLNNDHIFVPNGGYQAGRASMGGMEALSYARMRKAEGDNDSDIKRTERQRKLINALLNNVKSSSLSQLQGILNEVLPMITTNMSGDKITEFMMEMIPILPQLKIEGGTCPVQSTYWAELKNTPDGEVYVLCFDAGQNKKLMRAITEAEGIE